MRGHPGPQHSLNATHSTAFRVPPRLSRGSPSEVSGEPFQAEPVPWSEKSSSSLTPQESLPDTIIVLQRSVSTTNSGHLFVGAVEGEAGRSTGKETWRGAPSDQAGWGKESFPVWRPVPASRGLSAPELKQGQNRDHLWVPSALNLE